MPTETPTATITVLYAGTPEARAWHARYDDRGLDEPYEPEPAHVHVTRYGAQVLGMRAGLERHEWGIAVTGYAAGYRQVYRRVVRGGERWDATARNNVGTHGAFVNEPPSDAQVQTAIHAAQQAIRAHA